MISLIEKTRQEPKKRRQTVALVGAGLIVAIIFVIWISTFSSRLASNNAVEEKVYKPTLVESVKRKAALLFSGLEFPQIGSPIEYKKATSSIEETEASRNNTELLMKTGIKEMADEDSFDELVEELRNNN